MDVQEASLRAQGLDSHREAIAAEGDQAQHHLGGESLGRIDPFRASTAAIER